LMIRVALGARWTAAECESLASGNNLEVYERLDS